MLVDQECMYVDQSFLWYNLQYNAARFMKWTEECESFISTYRKSYKNCNLPLLLFNDTLNLPVIPYSKNLIHIQNNIMKKFVYWIENFIKIINRQYLFRYYLLQDKAPSASFYNIREEHHQAEIRTLNNTIKLNTWISVLDDLKNDKDERIKKELEFWIN
ncbi:hypothetical protein RclHR1_01210006 [Rhizophagus clarus]|uniref:Uncharacterized protein n=1 Tax=Rhizophagus clarus TaxID=94130 RepID=A0A2Z6QY53_9GLOM|nr:hypothetical protein RclHR1_01210006 [Rhizophagus clarus]